MSLLLTVLTELWLAVVSLLNSLKLSIKSRGIFFPALIFLALLTNAIFLCCHYQIFFEPIDTGGFPTVAYRFISSQKPYVDFLYMSGPTHPLLIAVFVKFFGYGAQSWLAHLLFISSGFLIVLYLICRRYLNFILSAFVLFVATVTFQWGYPHPNYTTDALFFLILALWLRMREVPLKGEASAYWHAFGCACAIVLACFARYNYGVPFLALFFFANFLTEHRSASLQGYLVGTLTSLFVICLFFIPDFHAFLHNNILTYARTKLFRMDKLISIQALLKNSYLPMVMAGLVFLPVKDLRHKLFNYLLIGCGVSSVFFFYTTTTVYFCVFPLLLALIVVHQLKSQVNSGSFLNLNARIFILIFLGLWEVFLYSKNIAEVYDFFRKRNTEILQTEEVRGWRAPTGWGNSFDALVQIVRKIVPPKASFAILTDMHFIYPITRRTPFPGLPINFHTDTLQYNERERMLIRDAVLKNPPEWVLVSKLGPNAIFKYDATTLLTELDAYIFKNYEEIVSVGTYALLRRRAAGN